MKNFAVFVALSLATQFASAAVSSLVCQQLPNQKTVVVTFDNSTQVLEVNKNGVAKDYTIVRTAIGTGDLDTVLLGESKENGEVQLNLGKTRAMVYQGRSNEVDYLTCVRL